MDYDNFRQMVLGANIKPMKSKEMAEVTNMINSKCKTKYNDSFLSPAFF